MDIPSELPRPLQRLIAGICAGAVGLLIATLAGSIFEAFTGHNSVHGLSPLLNLRVEGNLPTFFHGSLLLSCGMLAAWIAHDRRTRNLREYYRHWVALSVVFTFLAADEAAGIHEMLNAPLRVLWATDGAFYFPWVLPYGLLTLVFAGFYFRFLLALAPWYRYRTAAAGVLYVAGALIVEMIQAWHFTRHGPDATYFTIWLTGETLEMMGSILFLYVLLRYLVTLRATDETLI